MSTECTLDARDLEAPTRCAPVRGAARRPPQVRSGRPGRRAGRPAHPHAARCARPSTRRRWTAPGRLRIAAAVGINGDVGAKAAAILDTGVDALVVDTAHGHQAKMLEALRGRALARPAGARRRRQRRHGRGRARPGRRRRGHRQGRRRARRHVHDAHDDGRGPPAVLGGARVRRRGARARQARLGRRRRAPPARCRARARGRCAEGDGRLVVRRHATSARATSAPTPTAGSTRRASAWRRRGRSRPAPPTTRPSTGRARRCSRRASRARGCCSTRPRPGVEDLLDQITSGVRSACTYVGARTLDELHERAVVGLQSSAGYDEGRPLPARAGEPTGPLRCLG